MASLTSELYRIGATSIASLQERFPNGDGFFFTASEVADPTYTFAMLVPLAAGLHTMLAADLLVASLVAEWSNTLLKWLIMEDRPYWWVREAELTGLQSIPVRQTPLTCETGPGCPSGHVMGATAVAYVLRAYFEQYFIQSQPQLSETKRRSLRIVSWCVLVVLMVLAGLSRLYIAAHFPHQCVLGFFCGLAVGHILIHHKSTVARWWRRASPWQMLSVATGMALASTGAYWLQRALGVDPQWSIRLAFKWCEKPEFLHVSTTPLFALVRACGAAFGVAVASPVYRSKPSPGNIVVGMALSGLTVMIAKRLADLIPTQHVIIFYILHCILKCAHTWVLLWLVPRIANMVPRTHKAVAKTE